MYIPSVSKAQKKTIKNEARHRNVVVVVVFVFTLLRVLSESIPWAPAFKKYPVKKVSHI